jgi:hypothetical protein
MLKVPLPQGSTEKVEAEEQAWPGGHCVHAVWFPRLYDPSSQAKCTPIVLSGHALPTGHAWQSASPSTE